MGGAPSEPGRRLGVGCAVERCEPIEHAGGRTMMRKMPIRQWPMLSCALLMVIAGSFAAGKPAVHVGAQQAAVYATSTPAADKEPGTGMRTARTYRQQRNPPVNK